MPWGLVEAEAAGSPCPSASSSSSGMSKTWKPVTLTARYPPVMKPKVEMGKKVRESPRISRLCLRLRQGEPHRSRITRESLVARPGPKTAMVVAGESRRMGTKTLDIEVEGVSAPQEGVEAGEVAADGDEDSDDVVQVGEIFFLWWSQLMDKVARKKEKISSAFSSSSSKKAKRNQNFLFSVNSSFHP